MDLKVKKVSSNRESRIENFICIELIRRGYDVFVGKYESREIDVISLKDYQYELLVFGNGRKFHILIGIHK